MGLCGRRTERACMIYPEPPKTVFQRSAQPAPAWEVCFLMPGLLSCAAGIPIPPKTIRQAFCISVHTYAKCLLGSGTQTPEKRRHSTCGAFARQHKRPLPGDWGQPPTSRFSRFSRRRKTGKSFRVYHETLLATIKNSYRGSTSYTNKAYHTECSQ